MSTKNLSRREWMRGGVAAVAATAIPGVVPGRQPEPAPTRHAAGRNVSPWNA